MHNLVIDVSILSIPKFGCSKDAILYYQESILSWKKLLDFKGINVYISQMLHDSLFTEKIFPSNDEISRAFSANGVSMRECPNDIRGLALKLLDKTAFIESKTNIKFIYVENPKLDPHLDYTNFPDYLREAYTQSILLTSLMDDSNIPHFEFNLLMIKELSFSDVRKLNVEAEICDFEKISHQNTILAPSPGAIFAGTFFACKDFQMILDHVDESRILAEATDHNGLILAIKIALVKYTEQDKRSLNFEGIDLPILTNGFIKSCLRICSDRNSAVLKAVLRAISEAVNEDNLQDAHPVRENDKPGSRNLKKNGSLVWRRDVNDDLHLHYSRQNEGLVIYSIGPHDEIVIKD